MNLVLQIANNQIPFDRVLEKMSEAQLLPQLLREIITDELIDRVARENQIDLTPTSEELDRLIAEVTKIRPFQGMNSDQITAIAARTIKVHKFKQAGWGHKVSSYYQAVQHQLYRRSRATTVYFPQPGELVLQFSRRLSADRYNPLDELRCDHSPTYRGVYEIGGGSHNNKYDSCDTHLAIPPRRDHSILPLQGDQRTILRKSMSYPPPFRKQRHLIILCRYFGFFRKDYPCVSTVCSLHISHDYWRSRYGPA